MTGIPSMNLSSIFFSLPLVFLGSFKALYGSTNQWEFGTSMDPLQMLILESLQNIENKSDFPIKDDDLVGGFPGT